MFWEVHGLAVRRYAACSTWCGSGAWSDWIFTPILCRRAVVCLMQLGTLMVLQVLLLVLDKLYKL